MRWVVLTVALLVLALAGIPWVAKGYVQYLEWVRK